MGIRRGAPISTPPDGAGRQAGSGLGPGLHQPPGPATGGRWFGWVAVAGLQQADDETNWGFASSHWSAIIAPESEAAVGRRGGREGGPGREKGEGEGEGRKRVSE